jgi:unsaturated rhamnogalacturonyl hydrolase
MFNRLLPLALFPLLAAAFPVEAQIILHNPAEIIRTGEPVVISRIDYEKKFPPQQTGDIPLLTLPGGTPVASQTDDLDGDGHWDELAFEVNIGALQTVVLDAGWVTPEKAPRFDRKTQVYLARENPDGTFTEVTRANAPPGLAGFPTKYQAEGVGWENDRIAFRVYFDCRNAKDLFGKRLPGLILQKAGAPGQPGYHELAPWGMDILHCGSSLGAGGLALVENDSLYRLGSTPGYRYVKIADGPVRAIFELRYSGWEVAGHTYHATERITLWAGKYGFESEVTAGDFTGVRQLATGITTTKLDGQPVEFKAGRDYTVLMTHGRQSLNNDILAMAVMAPSKETVGTGRTSDIDFYQRGYQTVPAKSFSQVVSGTAYLSQTLRSGTPSVHRFYAMWGLEDPKWNDPANVEEYLKSEAEKLSNPLTINLLGNTHPTVDNRRVFKKSYIRKAMLTAAFWQLDHPKHEPNHWANGAFYAGVMAAWETTGSKKLYRAMMDLGRSTGWKPADRLHHADDYAICQTYIDLYRLEKNPEMIGPTIDSLNKMMSIPYPTGGIRKICWWWCDALFMAPPALVKLGETLHDDRYIQFSDSLFRQTFNLLWNPADSLFARDLGYVWGYGDIDRKESNGKRIYWSRGNSWVMGGLARILQELPHGDPRRGFYVDLFRTMAKRISELQQPDGLWRSSLLDPDAYPGGEASGSGFYCYAMAWGINNGLLDRKTYLPVVKKAWIGLNTLLTPEGFVGWVQPVGADPQKDFSPVSWEVYGTGAFLLAGSEVGRLKK